MESSLAKAIEARLRMCRIPFEEIVIANARLIVCTERNEEAAIALSKVFGVVSVSPAIEIGNDINEISEMAVEIARKHLGKSVNSFAIRARRDKRYPITSKDIEKIVGQRVKEATGLRVDLENPDLEIGIEVWSDRAFIYTTIVKGPGGLPYGAEGKVVSLFSGGMDSALATWLALKRGCIVKLVFMDPGRFWSDEARVRVLEVAKVLREWVPEPLELLVVNYEKVMERILESVEPRLRCIICKSCMISIASEVAKSVGAKAIVTGESLGQVASQTLDNLHVISRFSSLPILRPLIFLDKEEIASMLRGIGLYSYVARSVGKCRLVPRAPETRAREEDLERYRSFVERICKEVDIYEVILD